MNPTCVCGHEADEHDYDDRAGMSLVECGVDGCDCVLYEPDSESGGGA